LFQNTTSSPLVTLIMTSGILLREGFEAVLILVALLGVIRALKVRRAAAYVHAGWIAALCCGVIAWLFSGWVLRISGAQRELLEGVTSLIAVVMLFYMGFWLHSKTEIGRWKAFIDGKVRQAAEQKNLLGLTFIAFISVFREVFETVLFLRAVWLESGNQAKTAMLAGVTGSLVAVFIMAWLLVRFSAKLPIRKLFSVSSILLIGLALILTGKGFHSLQETGALSVTALPFSLRWDFVGVYGTVETLFSQLVVLAIAIGLWLYTRRPNIANSQRTS
jgi:high-affinity iron transporter